MHACACVCVHVCVHVCVCVYCFPLQLLSQETAVSTIIPFLLELGEFDKALDQAIASGDPDLSEHWLSCSVLWVHV